MLPVFPASTVPQTGGQPQVRAVRRTPHMQ